MNTIKFSSIPNSSHLCPKQKAHPGSAYCKECEHFGSMTIHPETNQYYHVHCFADEICITQHM